MRVLGWAHTEIGAWINREDRDFAIRTVSGGPGSGKSSFARITASELASANNYVLFVPLHQVDFELGIARALSEYFKEAGHFSDDPLSADAHGPVILLLDGLDEIQMQGRASQESAQSFVNDLIRYVDRKNTASCKLLCLITGRDLAVESAEGSLKVEGQVLHLFPYYVGEYEKPSFDDKEGIFAIDQRNEWWCRYGLLTGQPYEAMPDTLRAGELGDVTSQPLLNYLVALSHRRGLKLDESTNINSVYEDLLKAVHARAWARHRHPSVKDVPYGSFVRLLEEVALSVWHGAGRTTTLAEVEAQCQQSKVGALLPSFQSGVSSGVSSLLLAFYFRQKGRRDDGSKTFEFTHKTFAEYLISLRIVRLVELLSSQMTAYESNPDLGIDAQDALHRWLNVCGQAALDWYLLDFVRREIAFRTTTHVAVLQKSLCILLESSMRAGCPIQRIAKLSFIEQQGYVRNAEETLLACLNACALVSREVSIVRWPSETAAGEMIARLRGQRKGPINRPVMGCLSYLNYDGQYLDMADLYKAELHHSSFEKSRLNYAVMLHANLSRSSFVGAQLQGANLSSANLTETKIPLNQLSRLHRPKFNEIGRPPETRAAGSSKSVRGRHSLFQSGTIVIGEDGTPVDREKVISELTQRGLFKGGQNALAPRKSKKIDS